MVLLRAWRELPLAAHSPTPFRSRENHRLYKQLICRFVANPLTVATVRTIITASGLVGYLNITAVFPHGHALCAPPDIFSPLPSWHCTSPKYWVVVPCICGSILRVTGYAAERLSNIATVARRNRGSMLIAITAPSTATTNSKKTDHPPARSGSTILQPAGSARF